MSNARDLPGLNTGETYNQELTRLSKFSDLLQKIDKSEKARAKKYKTKEFLGQIYTKRVFTKEELASIVSKTFLEALGTSSSYYGFKVFVPELLAVYPNLTEGQIKLYNRVSSNSSRDPKSKRLLTKKEWFESQPTGEQKKFLLLERRLARFPWFFSKSGINSGDFPALCKIRVFDDGAPLNYGEFLEVKH